MKRLLSELSNKIKRQYCRVTLRAQPNDVEVLSKINLVSVREHQMMLMSLSVSAVDKTEHLLMFHEKIQIRFAQLTMNLERISKESRKIRLELKIVTA